MSKSPPAENSRVRETLALNIKRRRAELDLSQEQLAYASGLHRTYIAHVERMVRNPSLDNVARIAEALGVEVFELLKPRRQRQ